MDSHDFFRQEDGRTWTKNMKNMDEEHQEHSKNMDSHDFFRQEHGLRRKEHKNM